MGLFSSDSKGGGGKDIKGSCKSKGCGGKVSGRNGKEANAAAMKHGKDEHGDRYLGFRWGK
jgi:hypothetical protein